MADCISLSFRDLLVLFNIYPSVGRVNKSDNALFSTSSARSISIYSTDIDNDEEKYWKHDKNQMFNRKIKQLSNIVFGKIWVLNASSSLKS